MTRDAFRREIGLSGLILFGLVMPMLAEAADLSPIGLWRTFDENNELRSIVEVISIGTEFEAKVVERFPPPQDTTQGICRACTGRRKDQPILGMTIMWGVESRQSENGNWGGGQILIPRTGSIYNVQLKLSADGESLLVRGYTGTPLFGKTQTWLRVQ